MKGKKLLAAFLAALMTIGLVPAVAFAEEAKEIYVSKDGSDSNDGLSTDSPVKTLSKAVDIAGDGDTVVVMSDLESTKCARFYNKNLTITSGEGGPYTVTRGDGFSTISDNARSWYNPAMIEVGGTKTDDSEELGKASLRLENITLDDAGKHEGTKFDFVKGKVGNTDYVQDSIIASYDGTGTITLGKGTTLKNFGGMTAVYITGSGKLIMENGSEICDDEETQVSKREDYINYKNQLIYAVYLIGASFRMDKGAYIQNIKGAEALNSEGADCTVNGTINEIEGKNNPIVRLVKNSNFELEGIISNNKTPSIATVYVHSGSVAHFYGEISNNKAPAGAIYIVTNGGDSYAYIYDGAEIINNTSTGKYGVIEVQQGDCTLTMNGGTISGNKAKAGAVQLRKGNAKFIMNGGSIIDNELLEGGLGDAGVYLTESSDLIAELNNGVLQSIAVNTDVKGKIAKGYIDISDDFNLQTGYVTMRQDSKTIAPNKDSFNIKLSNASNDNGLRNYSSQNGWNTPAATFWAQRNGSAKMELGGLTIDSNLPVYVMTQKTDETGIPEDNAEIKVYRAEISDGKCCFTIPAVDLSDDGCAVAIVQPTADYGTFYIDAPKSIKKNTSGEDYIIDYTATYTLSNNLASQIEVGQEFDVKIELDKAISDVIDVELNSTAFEPGETNATYNKNTGILSLSIKAKSLETGGTAVLTFRAVLPNSEFETGEVLNAAGIISGYLPNQTHVVVPSNVAETKLEALDIYTVRFDEGSHGTIDGDTKIKVTDGEKVDYVPDVEPDEDYRFIGWKIDDEGKLLSDDDVADYTVTENITFVAQYEKKNSDSGYELPEKHIERPEEKPELETKEHFQYISGYPDGTVRPNANITRAEVATIFYRLLSDDSRNAYFSTVENFSDVQSTDWYLKAVATLTNAGILHGDEGADTFRPNDSITRAEFATIVSFFDDLSYTGEDRFSDIAGHWANAYINSASANGWINGYPNGTYNPDAAITRAEAMTIINNVLGREVDGEGLHWKTKMWPDNPNYAWYYYEVLEATNYHDYVRENADEAEEWTDIRPNKVWNEGAAN